MNLSKHSLLLIAAVLVSGCGKKTASVEQGPEPLAIVGGEKILPQDLLSEIAWRKSNDQSVPASDVLLQQMVDRMATVQRARKAGLDKEPDTRRRMETQLIASLREKELERKIRAIEITDAEIEAAYQAGLSSHSKKALNRFAILFIAADRKASENSRNEARERILEARARAAESPASGGRGPAASGFGNLPLDFSDDQASRHRGGDVGWIEEGAAHTRFPAELLATGGKLETGALSDVIETDAGFYLIRKTDSRPGGVTPLAEVADGIRQNLLRDRRSAIEESFVNETRSAASPSINAAALSAMNLPAGPSTRSTSEALPLPDVTSAPAR